MGSGPSVIKEGIYKCSVTSQEAYLEDFVSCFFFQLPYQLENLHFSFISAALLFIIIIISIFGRIKLHYRWFILNQSIIDILTCHDFICSKFGENRGHNYQTCYYTGWLRDCVEWNNVIYKLPCLALFLLTGSRFLAVYFSRIYKKVTKSWAIVLGIFLIDIAYISFNFSNNLLYFQWSPAYSQFNCSSENNQTLNEMYNITINCASTNRLYMVMQWQEKIDRNLPIIALFFSITFIILLIAKIRKQMNFQKDSNKELLKANIRIAIVFSIQTFILAFIFVVDFFNEMRLNHAFSLPPGYPKWINWIIHEDTIRGLRLIRVFIDSIVVLTFMGGYREDVFFGIVWLLYFPKRIWKKLKSLKHIIKKKNSITSLLTI